MITYARMTMEEALTKSFKEDRTAIERVLSSENDASITVTIKFEYECPASYAKVILIDYLSEKLDLPGVTKNA